MKSFVLAGALAGALAILGGCATRGQATPPPPGAGMAFAEFETIFDWQGDGSQGIYIESDAHKWFYAAFTAPCDRLPSAVHVGFYTSPFQGPGRFDALQVQDEVCYFKTFEPSSSPPSSKTKAAK